MSTLLKFVKVVALFYAVILMMMLGLVVMTNLFLLAA